MPFLFLTFGILFLVAGARNTQSQLLTLLKGDLLGKPNFLFWFAAILAIGVVGYVPSLRPVSRAFLVLVIIVLFLKNGGVFQNALSALQSTEKATATGSSSTVNGGTPATMTSDGTVATGIYQ